MPELPLPVWVGMAIASMAAGGLLAWWAGLLYIHRHTTAPVPEARPVEHTGWEQHPGELAALRADTEPDAAEPDAEYQPRHDEDSITWRLVPSGWMPPVGVHALHAAVDLTEEMPPVRDDPPAWATCPTCICPEVRP